MTAVFVHGVPETPAVWSGLLAALGRPDSVALPLPGFDGVRPEGFGATMDEYAAWLVAQLERLDDPVDLVGHDWGGGFAVRVVSTRPELVRSWSPMPPVLATPGSSGMTSPRSGRHRRRGKTSGTSSWRPRPRSGPGSSRRSGCPGAGPGPGIATQPHHG